MNTRRLFLKAIAAVASIPRLLKSTPTSPAIEDLLAAKKAVGPASLAGEWTITQVRAQGYIRSGCHLGFSLSTKGAPWDIHVGQILQVNGDTYVVKEVLPAPERQVLEVTAEAADSTNPLDLMNPREISL